MRSTAEKALTLINQHELVCTTRYVELREAIAANSPVTALKWVHIGIGMCLAVNFFVGIFIALHH